MQMGFNLMYNTAEIFLSTTGHYPCSENVLKFALAQLGDCRSVGLALVSRTEYKQTGSLKQVFEARRIA